MSRARGYQGQEGVRGRRRQEQEGFKSPRTGECQEQEGIKSRRVSRAGGCRRQKASRAKELQELEDKRALKARAQEIPYMYCTVLSTPCRRTAISQLHLCSISPRPLICSLYHSLSFRPRALARRRRGCASSLRRE